MTHDDITEAVTSSLEGRVRDAIKGVLEQVMEDGVHAEDGDTTYRFRMNKAIPPYLIALAIGDLEVGPRSGVWAEPGVVESAAYEFADMEEMIDAAEALYGP